MNIFDKISKSRHDNSNTTKGMYLGAPESEGEIGANSRINLVDVFEDYFEIFNKLKHEQFIITGRKGSGKSAIGQYLFKVSDQEPNVFCDFVRKSDLDLQQIVQIGKEKGHPIESSVMFQWVILYKIITLIASNESMSLHRNSQPIKKFLEKNSGFVSIDSYRIKEYVEKSGIEINIEQLKKFFTLRGIKELETKRDKAPFYTLIPHLKKVIEALLVEDREVENENQYVIIFDDLDIGFKEGVPESIFPIVELIRIAKEYNVSFFGSKGMPIKIVLLLRDDVKRVMVSHEADTAKIFASYEIPLIWYENEKFKLGENGLAIKKFLNSRIAYNFKKKGLEYNSVDPWSSFVKAIGGESRFKEILELTFFRPRDLLLFFKHIEDNDFALPLDPESISKLKRKYSDEVVSEIKSELSLYFEKEEITSIFSILEKCSESKFVFVYFKKLVDASLKDDALKVANILFNYSLIGHVDGGFWYFKHREKPEEPVGFDESKEIVLHRALLEYFNSHRNRMR